MRSEKDPGGHPWWKRGAHRCPRLSMPSWNFPTGRQAGMVSMGSPWLHKSLAHVRLDYSEVSHWPQAGERLLADATLRRERRFGRVRRVGSAGSHRLKARIPTFPPFPIPRGQRTGNELTISANMRRDCRIPCIRTIPPAPWPGAAVIVRGSPWASVRWHKGCDGANIPFTPRGSRQASSMSPMRSAMTVVAAQYWRRVWVISCGVALPIAPQCSTLSHSVTVQVLGEIW